MSLIPGALFDPGVHWNYQAGYTLALMLVWHYTVGANSIALIRDRGLAPVLIRDAVLHQFAPLDARCFTQCEFNGRAIGYEVESLDGSISEAELGLLGYATVWAITQHGIPPGFYDGPRMPVGTPYQGVTNHRNLVHNACDMHSDGFDQWVWDAIMGGATPPRREDDGMFLYGGHPTKAGTILGLAMCGNLIFGRVEGPPGYADLPMHPDTDPLINGGNAPLTIRIVHPIVLTAAILMHDNALIPPGGGGGGGTVPADVATKADVAASEQRVRQDVNKARTVQ